MNTVIQIIDEAALPVDEKNTLKQLVQRYLDASAEETDALADLHKTRAAINERQYAKRLAENVSQEKREEILLHQYAWRNWYVNSVVRIYQTRTAKLEVNSALNSFIERYCASSDRSVLMAMTAIKVMITDSPSYEAKDVMQELDKVSDVSRDRLVESLRAIFLAKRDRKGALADANFTSVQVRLIKPTAEQEAVEAALLPAIEIRARFEALWSDFHAAKSRFNVPQFTQRVEQAFAAGDSEKAERIIAERRQIEAALYLAANRYVEPHAELERVAKQLDDAVRHAADSIKDLGSTEGLIAMSHCISAWKWWHELTGYIAGKYKSADPAGVLKELGFDPARYLSA